MDYKQCCIECQFHFFDEDECPNCWAERVTQEAEAEWNRQLKQLECQTGIECNDDFWSLWYADDKSAKDEFRNICEKVAPDIYEWYLGLDMEREREKEMFRNANQQLGLFEEPLPF